MGQAIEQAALVLPKPPVSTHDGGYRSLRHDCPQWTPPQRPLLPSVSAIRIVLQTADRGYLIKPIDLPGRYNFSQSLPVVSFESRAVHQLLTSAMYNPSLLRKWPDLASALAPYTILDFQRPADYSMPVTYRALMMDTALSIKRLTIWSFIALSIAVVVGLGGGGCLARQKCDVDFSLDIGSALLSVFVMIQMIICMLYQRGL
ncbi:hypothetical protein ASPWEDRAFT_43927 [Aspergillus wentii DTO 134E9]|uniref:Uncharacterized protein n=1 Tax=Aspergillus wentii DTO 134E9 TaxID=1073089 RepID=A0A1L9RAF7_ASPWE|nr:uncharacterized protein ASPWEDRAFT_43927 [Aspergillus wentii DTO 134E9]OJJ31902.1 hypothetical protein ASPWEDRAFT_43927 [Aspergillus wentii DTO 134E9]